MKALNIMHALWERPWLNSL